MSHKPDSYQQCSVKRLKPGDLVIDVHKTLGALDRSPIAYELVVSVKKIEAEFYAGVRYFVVTSLRTNMSGLSTLLTRSYPSNEQLFLLPKNE